MEKFSFSKFSIFNGVFATFWLSGTSSRTVNAAKSLYLRCWLNKNLSKKHEKIWKSKNPLFFTIWISIKYACMQYQFDTSLFAVLIKSKTFLTLRKFALLWLPFKIHWVSTTFSLKIDKNRQISLGILDFSKIYPTLESCISELNEYFLMGPVPL